MCVAGARHVLRAQTPRLRLLAPRAALVRRHPARVAQEGEGGQEEEEGRREGTLPPFTLLPCNCARAWLPF